MALMIARCSCGRSLDLVGIIGEPLEISHSLAVIVGELGRAGLRFACRLRFTAQALAKGFALASGFLLLSRGRRGEQGQSEE